MRFAAAVAVFAVAALVAGHSRERGVLRLRLAGSPALIFTGWLACLRYGCGLDLTEGEVAAPVAGLIVAVIVAVFGPPFVVWWTHDDPPRLRGV